MPVNTSKQNLIPFLFHSSTGVIESFNFGHYFNNLDYAICIEHEPSSCKIAFSAAEGDFGIEPTAKFRTGRQNTDLAASGDIICADDYFMIPSGSANGNFPTKDRYNYLYLTVITD